MSHVPCHALFRCLAPRRTESTNHPIRKEVGAKKCKEATNGAPGLSTRSKDATSGAPGITTSSILTTNVTRNYERNKGITPSTPPLTRSAPNPSRSIRVDRPPRRPPRRRPNRSTQVISASWTTPRRAGRRTNRTKEGDSQSKANTENRKPQPM